MILHIKPPWLTDAETETLINQGVQIGVYRQCSIGFHEECSDPAGEECQCFCHRGKE